MTGVGLGDVRWVGQLAALVETPADCVDIAAEVRGLAAEETAACSKGDRSVLRHLDAAVLYLVRASEGHTGVALGGRLAADALSAAGDVLQRRVGV